MTITPLQLTAQHIGKTITVQKPDGTSISGKLTGLDMHVKLTKKEETARALNDPRVIVRYLSEPNTTLTDCSCLIGTTRVTINDNDTILVEE